MERSDAEWLCDVRAAVDANRAAGRDLFAGMSSADIGRYHRAEMFGDNDEAFPDDWEWSRIVD